MLVLANGCAGNRKIVNRRSPGYAEFASALARACLDLALMIVRDGEGVHRVVTVRVEGARSFAELRGTASIAGVGFFDFPHDCRSRG